MRFIFFCSTGNTIMENLTTVDVVNRCQILLACRPCVCGHICTSATTRTEQPVIHMLNSVDLRKKWHGFDRTYSASKSILPLCTIRSWQAYKSCLVHPASTPCTSSRIRHGHFYFLFAFVGLVSWRRCRYFRLYSEFRPS